MYQCPSCGYVKPKLTQLERARLIREGLKRTKKIVGRPRLHDFEKIRAMRGQGHTYQEIADKLKITRADVYYAVKRAAK